MRLSRLGFVAVALTAVTGTSLLVGYSSSVPALDHGTTAVRPVLVPVRPPAVINTVDVPTAAGAVPLYPYYERGRHGATGSPASSISTGWSTRWPP